MAIDHIIQELPRTFLRKLISSPKQLRAFSRAHEEDIISVLRSARARLTGNKARAKTYSRIVDEVLHIYLSREQEENFPFESFVSTVAEPTLRSFNILSLPLSNPKLIIIMFNFIVFYSGS